MPQLCFSKCVWNCMFGRMSDVQSYLQICSWNIQHTEILSFLPVSAQRSRLCFSAHLTCEWKIIAQQKCTCMPLIYQSFIINWTETWFGVGDSISQRISSFFFCLGFLIENSLTFLMTASALQFNSCAFPVAFFFPPTHTSPVHPLYKQGSIAFMCLPLGWKEMKRIEATSCWAVLSLSKFRLRMLDAPILVFPDMTWKLVWASCEIHPASNFYMCSPSPPLCQTQIYLTFCMQI